MSGTEKLWGIVLAGGDGRRLQSMTTGPDGTPVPKQYCRLRGSETLIERALERAHRLAPPERTVAVVARQHRRWWTDALRELPADNIVVQPQNRGTAPGLLLPLLHVWQRDPEATVFVLPSDHHVEEESVMRDALREAIAAIEEDPSHLVLLGIEPESPDTEYGWILPRRSGDRLQPVAAFVEKPSAERASQLMSMGASWNSFVFAAKASTLLDLLWEGLPELTSSFADCWLRHGAEEGAWASLYERIGTHDFSREVLQGRGARLRVLSVPACGWTDLGTPPRVLRWLSAEPPARAHAAEPAFGSEFAVA